MATYQKVRSILNNEKISFEREINKMYSDERNMTRDQLKKHFDSVSNSEGWKLPIDSICNFEDIKYVSDAVIFFTGSVPSFKSLGNCKYSVKAVGYYAAVGA